MSDDIKKAERRGYQNGYRAGKKALHNDDNWNRAFLAVLPACVNAEGWERNENGKKTKIRGVYDRVRLASDFADAAAQRMK